MSRTCTYYDQLGPQHYIINSLIWGRLPGTNDTFQDMNQSFAPMQTRSSHMSALASPPTTTPVHHSTPAFLSLFPRSLSSLSLGTRKKDKETESSASHNHSKTSLGSAFSPPGSTTPASGGGGGKKGTNNSSASHRHSQQMHSSDIPPPLPQRNPPRKSLDINSNPFEIFRNTPISDLDHSGSGVISPHNLMGGGTGDANNKSQSKAMGQTASPTTTTASNSNDNNNGSGKKKRSKNKTKALSDPKMSSQMFIQMEQGQGHGELTGKPPPLPPRQYLLDENRLNNNLSNSNSRLGGADTNSSSSNNHNRRGMPNSIETVFNYPLVSQCTPVRDNLTPFPFTHRPNIVQKLQEHQQQGYSFREGGGGASRQSPQHGAKEAQQQKGHHDNPVLSTSSHISANKSTVSKLMRSPNTPTHPSLLSALPAHCPAALLSYTFISLLFVQGHFFLVSSAPSSLHLIL